MPPCRRFSCPTASATSCPFCPTWRGFEVVVESVGDTEAAAIERLRAGGRLGEVTAGLAAAGAEADAVAGLFARWASLGLVVSCRPLRSL